MLTLCAPDVLVTVRWFVSLVQFTLDDDGRGLTVSDERLIDCVTDQPLDQAVDRILADNPGWNFAGAWEPADDCPF